MIPPTKKMKTIVHTFTVTSLMVVLIGCKVSRQNAIVISSCTEAQEQIQSYTRAADVNNALEKIIRSGVPGVALAVYSSEGWWETATGLADIESNLPMQTCHLQYLQSVSKTYTAVAILKLYEYNKLALDTPITTYLPEKFSRYITDAQKVTVRMLLNHTSGIPEYNYAPGYVSKLLQQPDYPFTAAEYLKYIQHKPLDSTPGTKYAYRNANYVILTLIADALTGDHAAYISENIFKPLGLVQTFYKNEPDYLNYPNLVSSYWDRHSNRIVENVSALQRNNVHSMVGDDGIVSTPKDAVKFLRGLLEGKLLKPETLDLMKTWVTNSEGNNEYGLGLDYNLIGGYRAWGHSGGGLGAGCQLYYFPDKNLYFFAAINLGTVTDSPLHKQVEVALNEFYRAMLE
jgi:D-alanyl-D-alanine carboxypeptidase